MIKVPKIKRTYEDRFGPMRKGKPLPRTTAPVTREYGWDEVCGEFYVHPDNGGGWDKVGPPDHNGVQEWRSDRHHLALTVTAESLPGARRRIKANAAYKVWAG